MDGRPLFKPLKSKRAFEEVAEQVKELIYSGILKPGDKLPCERELAAQFNVARLVVREAMRILEQSGFVKIRQGSEGGPIVKSFDSMIIRQSITDMVRIGSISIQHLTEARLGFENAILELAMERRTLNDLRLMEKNIEETEKLVIQKKRPYQYSLEFHLLLARATRNPLYELIVESVMNVMRSFVFSADPEEEYTKRVLNHHKEIYKAVRDKNLSAAKQKLQDHFVDIRKKYSRIQINFSNKRTGKESYLPTQ
jgi:GntR family transcriptional repressor for pyruvate dehydrogenase complex